MAKSEDIKINIRVTCDVDDHCFDKFDATRIYCRKCGQFRSAPGTTYIPPTYPWTYPWTAPQPTIWWSTTTDTKTTTYNS